MQEKKALIPPKNANKKRQTKSFTPSVTFWAPVIEPNLSSRDSLKIDLTPQGFAIEGLKFNLSSFPRKLQSYLRWAFCLNFVLQFCCGENTQSYFFKDIKNVTYKLFLSGVENLSIVITQLKSGQCNTTDSDYMPEKLVQIEAYYDHGGTVPMYAATLSRDENGETSSMVHQCVTRLLANAHDLWEQEATSGSTLGIIFGVLGGVALLVGGAACLYFKHRKSTKYEEVQDFFIPMKEQIGPGSRK